MKGVDVRRGKEDAHNGESKAKEKSLDFSEHSFFFFQ